MRFFTLVASAQREPVLRQIQVPHSYYYREMYLPQLTSGPSGATWSPDGRELIYSMQARSGAVAPRTSWHEAGLRAQRAAAPVSPVARRAQGGPQFRNQRPLLGFTLQGRQLGDEVRLGAGSHRLNARVTLRSLVPIDHLEIVGNGAVADIPPSGNRTQVSTTVAIPVKRSGWYLLRARGDRSIYPVLDVYPYATTSPIYVTVGDQPVRSSADAEYFIAWIDRLFAAAEAHPGWNSAPERSKIIDNIRRARAEFQRRKANEPRSGRHRSRMAVLHEILR
jgi:hypothetical protein